MTFRCFAVNAPWSSIAVACLVMLGLLAPVIEPAHFPFFGNAIGRPDRGNDSPLCEDCVT
jgi:hypothetical protein